MSRRFRGAIVAALRRAADDGALHRVTRPGEIDAVLDRLVATEWVVYAKDCLDHSATVVDFLARYTHRIAISNARILDIDAQDVTLRYTDYRDHNRTQVMRLDGEEFVGRFLLHILPKGLMRVRHYGFLANRCRKVKLARIREALNQPPPEASADPEGGREPATYPCPGARSVVCMSSGFWCHDPARPTPRNDDGADLTSEAQSQQGNRPDFRGLPLHHDPEFPQFHQSA